MAKNVNAESDTPETEAAKKTRELKPRPVYMAIEAEGDLGAQIAAAVKAGTLRVVDTTRDAGDMLVHVQSGGVFLQGMMK